MARSHRGSGTQKEAGALVDAVRTGAVCPAKIACDALAFCECLLDHELTRLAVIAFDKTLAEQ